jgi:hypothetical protein
MNRRSTLNADLLFILALVALLAGIGLLIETTGLLPLHSFVGPIAMMALGGAFLYLSIVRGRSGIFLGTGIFFALAGLVLLLAALGFGLRRTWPLLMMSAGLAWYAYGLQRNRRHRMSFVVTALLFIVMGLFFSIFSLGIAAVSFSHFVAIWWPSALIAGGAALFVAYGLTSGRRGGRKRPGSP